MTILRKKTRILSVFVILLLIFTYVFTSGFSGAESVYLGGMPIGVVQKCQGVVVSDYAEIATARGTMSPAKNAGVLKGDLIRWMDGVEVYSALDVEELTTSKVVKLSVVRGSHTTTIEVTPAFDIAANKYKLGLILKNELSGVGTMTYVKPNKHFGAVGHQIYDKNISTSGAFPTGDLFCCNISGFDKSKDYKPGSLRGVFSKKTDKIGSVYANTKFGVYGTVDIDFINMQLVQVASRREVSVGAASFFTTIDGEQPREYSIEIIKIENQSEPKEKSIVFKVVDEQLIATTGGILQGMSGSPILQNGKLIGAVTHVFTSNAIYGYGLFIEWMLDN